MAKDGGLVVSVSLNRKDTTLVIKAETDSIVPTLTMESEETVARNTLESEREEKPPDKVPWWQQWKNAVIAVAWACIIICILPIIKNILKKWLKRNM